MFCIPIYAFCCRFVLIRAPQRKMGIFSLTPTMGLKDTTKPKLGVAGAQPPLKYMFNWGLNWLKIYGMNSITAYLLGEVVNFRCVVASVSYGLERYLGDYYSVWLCFSNYLIVFFILRQLYKRNVFLRI